MGYYSSYIRSIIPYLRNVLDEEELSKYSILFSVEFSQDKWGLVLFQLIDIIKNVVDKIKQSSTVESDFKNELIHNKDEPTHSIHTTTTFKPRPSMYSTLDAIPEEICDNILSFSTKDELLSNRLSVNRKISKSAANMLKGTSYVTVNLDRNRKSNFKGINNLFLSRIINENEIRVVRFEALNACNVNTKAEMEKVIKLCDKLHTIDIAHNNAKCNEETGYQCQIDLMLDGPEIPTKEDIKDSERFKTYRVQELFRRYKSIQIIKGKRYSKSNLMRPTSFKWQRTYNNNNKAHN